MIDPFTVLGGVSAAASLAEKLLKMPTKDFSCRYDEHTKTICVKLISSESDTVLGVRSKDFLFACASPWLTSELRSVEASKSELIFAIPIRDSEPTAVFFRADPVNKENSEHRSISIYTRKNVRPLEVEVP